MASDQEPVYIEDPDDCRSESLGSDIELISSPGSIQRGGGRQGEPGAAQSVAVEMETKQLVQRIGKHQLQLKLKEQEMQSMRMRHDQALQSQIALCGEMKAENVALKQKNEDLSQKLQTTEIKLAIIETTNKMTSEEKGKLETRSREKKEKSKIMKGELHQKEIDKVIAEERLGATENIVQDLTAKQGKADEDKQKLLQKYEDQEKKLQDANVTLTKTKTILDEKQKHDQEVKIFHNQTKEDMSNRLQKLDTAMLKQIETSTATKEEAIKAQAQLKEMAEMNKSLEKENNKLETKCANLEEENAKLTKAAHSHEMKSTTLVQQQEKSTEREKWLHTQMEAQIKENTNKSQKIAELTSELDKIKGERTSSTSLLNQQISEIRSENGELKQTINELRRTLCEKDGNLQQHEKLDAALRDEMDKKTKQSEEKRRIAQDELNEMRLKIGLLQQRCETLEEQKKKQASLYKRCEDGKSKLEDENAGLLQQIRELEKNVHAFEVTNNTLVKDLETTKRNLNFTSDQLKTEKAETSSLSAVIKDLKEQLDRLKEKSAADIATRDERVAELKEENQAVQRRMEEQRRSVERHVKEVIAFMEQRIRENVEASKQAKLLKELHAETERRKKAEAKGGCSIM